MLYKVLTFALTCCAPIGAASAPISAVDRADVNGAVAPTAGAAEMRSLISSGTPGSPFFIENGNEMWDPLGAGCVDLADPVAWLPTGRRNPDAGAACLPQPCARLLNEEEMERDVLGRPLREGEWDTYTRRYSRACSTSVMWEVETETAIDLLPEDSVGWTEAAYSQNLAVYQIGRGSPRPFAANAGFLRSDGGGWSGSGGRSRGAGGGMKTGDRTPSFGDRSPAGPFAPIEEEPQRNVQADDPPSAGGNDASRTAEPQPTPVPLPGSFLMLAAAVAALRLRCR